MSGPTSASTIAPPVRLGFLGTGWIGVERMRAVIDSGVARAIAVSDPDPQALDRARQLSDGAAAVGDLDALLELEPDGVVIATPSALHAEQAIGALERGVAVFCQKPLARTAAETERVLAAAQACGRPLGVDLSYRHTAVAQRLSELLGAGALADLHAIDLTFHNAYGPDKAWFTDRRRSGGGAVIDLATHLLDLALWLTGEPGAEADAALLRHRGARLSAATTDAVEDFAWALLHTPSGLSIRLACSWFLPAGQDCLLECAFYGREEALVLHNVEGSFYDFSLTRQRGTERETLVRPPDAWGGRALVAWAEQLRAGAGFDPTAAASHRALARTIDAIYARGLTCG